MLKGFSGDSSKLGLAEDFFHKLIAVKQYPLRVTFMTLTLEFRDKMADLRPAIAVLQDAIQEVVLCEALREVFYITLLTGNIINGVTKGLIVKVKFLTPFFLSLREVGQEMPMGSQCHL